MEFTNSMYGLWVSFLLGLIGAWFVSRFAYRFGLLDIPNDRSSHDLPTPRGGGVGILAAFVVSSLLLKLPTLFWLPAALLSLVSLFDDKLDLTPKTRLLFQFAAALIVVGFSPHVSHFSPVVILLAICLAIFVVGTANFFNFMDGINGIAGITGTVGFALLALFARSQLEVPSLSLFASCVAVSCLGFLPLNVPRARVFMGDVGSILLGFLFAATCVLLTRSACDFLVLCGFLSTFYADALTTLFIRKRDGEKLSQAHRRHLYQLLANQMRIPHWKVSLGYGLLQAAVGIMLLQLRPYGTMAVVAGELGTMAGWLLVMTRVRRSVEHRQDGRAPL